MPALLQMVLIWAVAVTVFGLILISSAVALVVRTARRGVDAVTTAVTGGGLRRLGVTLRAYCASMALGAVGWLLLDLAYYGFPTVGAPSWRTRLVHAGIAVAGLMAFRLSEEVFRVLRMRSCHHCDEPTPSGHCWWCGGPAPRLRQTA